MGGMEAPPGCYYRTPCPDPRPLGAGGMHTMGGREGPQGATLEHHVRTQGPSVRDACTPRAGEKAPRVLLSHTMCGLKAPRCGTHAHHGREGGPPGCYYRTPWAGGRPPRLLLSNTVCGPKAPRSGRHARDGRDGGPPLCPLPNTMCGNQALGWPPLGCWKKASPFQTSQWLLGANLECFFSSLGGSDPPPPPPPHPGGAGLGPPGGQGERLGVADKPHLSHGPECRSEKFGSWDRWGFGKRTSKPPCMGMPRGTDEQVRCCQRLHYQVPYIGQGSFGVALCIASQVREPRHAHSRGGRCS